MNTTKISILLLILAQNSKAYTQHEEAVYLANFDEIMSSSYSVINDSSVAPDLLISECKASSNNIQSGDIETVTLKATSGNTLSSDDAVNQCGTSSSCILPSHLTLIMSSSLNLAEFIVRGSILWDDYTQTSSHQWLCAGYIAIENAGSFKLHLESSDKMAWIYIKDNGSTHSALRSRAFGAFTSGLSMEKPIIDINGREMIRTWSLLAEPLNVGDTHMYLLHNPEEMNWNIGDRIAIAPTGMMSDGTGQAFKIIGFESDNKLLLDTAASFSYRSNFDVSPGNSKRVPGLQSAEVVNLSRNVVITGDDFTNIGCTHDISEAIPGEQTSIQGCKCGFRSQCTMGLHVIHMNAGVHRIQNTRVENCGQRGVEGKYCLHFHKMSSCPDCLLKNNAIENSQQRGIIVHDTHLSKVTQNVLYNVRGAGLYIEDGNEMWNTLDYNVIICPWPLNDPVHRGCTIPGTSNGQSDTILNQSGIYGVTPSNHLIGNRAANSFNGMLIEANHGRGASFNRVCNNGAPLGRMEGNTFHSHGRFGTYMLNNNFPKKVDTSITKNGYFTDRNTCNGFTDTGEETGYPVAINNHFDYGNAFVGHYNGGDIQYKNHISIESLNLMYWKENKSFADKCSSFLSGGYYKSGNMALPDQGTIIIENTIFDGDVSFEANHHCNVGNTGVLCMPHYFLYNVEWNPTSGRWVRFQNENFQPHNANQNHGGIFSELSTSNNFLPDQYVSLVSNRFDYLVNIGGDSCTLSSALGFGHRYDHGILCKLPLRALKIYTKDLRSGSAPQLHVKVWNHDTDVPDWGDSHTTEQYIGFHQVGLDGHTDKQGYSLPVLASLDFSYEISLEGGAPVPSDWIIEFSDPIMGNKFDDIDMMRLKLVGRNCGSGENEFGEVSSQHDRKFIWADSEFHLGPDAWGRGACTVHPDEDPVDCGAVPDLEAASCPHLCSSACPSNSYCSCDLPNTCTCKPGFFGSSCSESLCPDNEHNSGICAATYLGGTLPISYSDGSSLHKEQPCEGITCNGNGNCRPNGYSDWMCECDPGFYGKACDITCDDFCKGDYPFRCATEVQGAISYLCNNNGGCHYITDPSEASPDGFCTYKTSNDNASVSKVTTVEKLTNENPCEGITCNGNGSCTSNGDSDWMCECDPGFFGDECNSSCDQFCLGDYPYGCATDLHGIASYLCNDNGGCHYLISPDDPNPDGFCVYKVSSANESTSKAHDEHQRNLRVAGKK